MERAPRCNLLCGLTGALGISAAVSAAAVATAVMGGRGLAIRGALTHLAGQLQLPLVFAVLVGLAVLRSPRAINGSIITPVVAGVGFFLAAIEVSAAVRLFQGDYLIALRGLVGVPIVIAAGLVAAVIVRLWQNAHSPA